MKKAHVRLLEQELALYSNKIPHMVILYHLMIFHLHIIASIMKCCSSLAYKTTSCLPPWYTRSGL